MQIKQIIDYIENLPEFEITGKVTAVSGNVIEAEGFGKFATVGAKCQISCLNHKFLDAEIIGFRGKTVLLLPFGDPHGVSSGSAVTVNNALNYAYPDLSWRGRVINANGEALDDIGYLQKGNLPYILKNNPPPAQKRSRVGPKIDLGLKAINCFTTCCQGQRMGIFAGSGVGKSVLISMLTKYADCQVKVIGLIGERGREVQEFIQDQLGPEGLKDAVVIVATSDEPALMRRQAAYLTMTVAEYFRDQGMSVLCMIDSVTRFAMAQREIGLAAGEPPTNKAYPPTVFSELPRLLERAGPGMANQGSITAFFSVLVEGDDHNEPIADTVRGILDGHIVLERAIAERGRYPAINILKSISRMMPACNSKEESDLLKKATYLISTYNDMAEMIRIGAYKQGSNAEVDLAIHYYPKLEEFLGQLPNEKVSMVESFSKLQQILNEQK